MRPAHLPARVDAYNHGTRGCYVAGCRCRPCKDSNNRYYHERRARELAALAELEPGPPAFERPVAHTKLDVRTGREVLHRFKNPCPGLGRDERELEQGCPFGSYLRKDSQAVCGKCRAESVADFLVDTGRARRRLGWLSRKGVGYKAAADAASVCRTIVRNILNGSKTQIRLSTERRILAVDAAAAAGGAIIDAAPMWRLLEELLKEGFTRAELARRLGYKSPALQFRRDRVTAATALRVAKFYRAIMAGGDEPPVAEN